MEGAGTLIMLIKTIGAILIIAGAASIGLAQRLRLARRVKILGDIIAALDLMYSEISCVCTPTEELLDKLCNTTEEPVKSFFQDCKERHQKRRDMPFELVWNLSLRDAEYLELASQEKQVLLELGNTLGRYNAEEELRAISHARRNIEGHLKAAQDVRARLGRLYGNLSLLSGIALVIILL